MFGLYYLYGFMCYLIDVKCMTYLIDVEIKANVLDSINWM